MAIWSTLEGMENAWNAAMAPAVVPNVLTRACVSLYWKQAKLGSSTPGVCPYHTEEASAMV